MLDPRATLPFPYEAVVRRHPHYAKAVEMQRAVRALLEMSVTATAIQEVPPGSVSAVSIAQQFAGKLDEWKTLLVPHHYDALVHHIGRLLGNQEELDEDRVIPSVSSFDDLLAFLSTRPRTRAPAMGMTRQGCFSASWVRRGSVHSDIIFTFLGNGFVKWYAYGLGRREKGSAAGMAECEDLGPLITRLGCDDWMLP